MRIAVVADIHGNVRALRAVMDDLKQVAPDSVVNLGDCASGPLEAADDDGRAGPPDEQRRPVDRCPHECLVPRQSLGRVARPADDRPLGDHRTVRPARRSRIAAEGGASGPSSTS